MQKCKNINQYDTNGQRHGYWEMYWGNGAYHHGDPIGYWNWDNNTEYYARM